MSDASGEHRLVRFMCVQGVGLVGLLGLVYALAASPEHDYVAYQDQWQLMLDGGSPWGFVGPHRNNSYGPLHNVFAWAYSVHTNLPRVLFACVWLALVAALARMFGRAEHLPGSWKVALIGFVLFNPLFFLSPCVWGTNDIIMTALVVAAVHAHRTGRDFLSGVSLALAIALKFMPLVMVPFLILDKGRIRPRFALGVLLGLVVSFGGATLIWGLDVFDPLMYAVERHSKNLSIFRFLRGSYSPLHLVSDAPNVDSASVLCIALALALLGFVHWRRRLAGWPSAVLALTLTMLFYKVGHHQLYVALCMVLLLWIATDPDVLRTPDEGSDLRNICPELVLLFIGWISGTALLYALTRQFRGDFSFMRAVIGLPTFMLHGLLAWSIWRTLASKESLDDQAIPTSPNTTSGTNAIH